MSTQQELIAAPRNVCQFSPCGKYRYILVHSWQKFGNAFVPSSPAVGDKLIMWIGLNPSAANEQQLDPTLRRIRWFSHEWGFRSFVMTNLFAYRATMPRDMVLQSDPVGPSNDLMLVNAAASSELVVACWGTHGSHLGRDASVLKLINAPLYCLGINADSSPRHPLYVPGIQKPIKFSE